MKKTVKIETVQLVYKIGWNTGDLLFNSVDKEYAMATQNCIDVDWQAHRLLILSDEVPATTPTEMIHNGKKIIASYPQLHNTLPVQKETVQAWIDAGCPNDVEAEVENDVLYLLIPNQPIANLK